MHKSLIAATSVFLLSAPLHAEDERKSLMAENADARAFQEQAGYAEAVIAGDFLYISGVVAGPAPGESDLKPGYDRAFKRIEKTLARAGLDWNAVVDLTTFHTDLRKDIDDFFVVKNRYIKAPFPAWTAIGITELFVPTGVVEIKVVAMLPKDDEAVDERGDEEEDEEAEEKEAANQ